MSAAGCGVLSESDEALPTMTPSATSRSVRTCSGRLMPKPTHSGRSVCVRSQRELLEQFRAAAGRARR